MLQLLEHTDSVRREISPRINQKQKSEMGQFMTPLPTARFMASLFPQSSVQSCRLLDAGAGVGSLTCAFLDRWISGGFDFSRVHACAVELDPLLREHLKSALKHYAKHRPVDAKVIGDDFIDFASELYEQGEQGFTHAILNPPYKKINSNSSHRLRLRSVGIETVNLYTAFVALALSLMAPGGQLVAIIPRSFCNGPYYRPFREFILRKSAIRQIHLFESRNTAFKDDAVLQENVILHLERCGAQSDVIISTSTDDSLKDLVSHTYPFGKIVPVGAEQVIHIPTSPIPGLLDTHPELSTAFSTLSIKVSTGPVVDFRVKEHLRAMPDATTAPLLYPGHFQGLSTRWPNPALKKPNAIHLNADTKRWLYPSGYYCVVRRFSSKEERRRVVASVIRPSDTGDANLIGLENHLNVFHDGRQGLPEALAVGLAAYLNTTAVDEQFRLFNGHTQVNAADLKMLKYPSRQHLIALGEWVTSLRDEPTQEMLDERLEQMIK